MNILINKDLLKFWCVRHTTSITFYKINNNVYRYIDIVIAVLFVKKSTVSHPTHPAINFIQSVAVSAADTVDKNRK